MTLDMSGAKLLSHDKLPPTLEVLPASSVNKSNIFGTKEEKKLGKGIEYVLPVMQHVAAIDDGAIGTLQKDHDPYGENPCMLTFSPCCTVLDRS
jgi:hypothetical protein